MQRKIVLIGLTLVFMLTSCALPGQKTAETAEPAKEVVVQPPTNEPQKPAQPKDAPTAKPAAPEKPAADSAPTEKPASSGLDFRDDFDLPNDNFTDDYILTTQATTRDRMQTQPSAVQDGIIEWNIRDAETYIYKFVKDSSAEDVVIEAKWISKGQSLNGIALICRAAEDNSSWYEALISAQGDWQILRYDRSIKEADPFKNPFVTIKKGVAKQKLVRPAGDNVSKFSCIGSKLTYEVNGLKLVETSNNDIKGGGLAGIGVRSSTYLPAQINFDYLSAKAP